MIARLKNEMHELRRGTPGQRFIQHYERRQRREAGRTSAWLNLSYIVGGVVLLVAGLLLSLPPGVPGFLLWIPGLGLLVARSRRLAVVLDAAERKARDVWRRVRS